MLSCHIESQIKRNNVQALIDHEKIPVLIYNLICTELWKEKVEVLPFRLFCFDDKFHDACHIDIRTRFGSCQHTLRQTLLDTLS